MTTPEALTPEERAYLIESFNVSALAHVLRDDDDNHVAKLLRIHDQQAARIAELERENAPLLGEVIEYLKKRGLYPPDPTG